MSVYLSTATSPFAHEPARSPHTTSTPTARHNIASVEQVMAPFMSPGPPPPHAHKSPSSKARSPSPNYFGFQSNATTLPISSYSHEPNLLQHWGPPSSTVASTAAFSPTTIPLDQHPDYAAFRRQSEGTGMSFNLGNLHNSSPNTSIFNSHEKSKMAHGHIKQTPKKPTLDMLARSPPSRPSPFALAPGDANLGRSPKRHLSSSSSDFPTPVRKPTPSSHGPGPELISSKIDITTSSRDMGPPVFALQPPSLTLSTHRSDTLPQLSANANKNEKLLVSPQHVSGLLDMHSEDVLLLDLRVSTQYARSRVADALNLCIPTTLMKRPSFNVTKLGETFKDPAQRAVFDKWRNSKYIIVYDAAASQLKDATICLNTIKKFESEGYGGTAYIIRGGFNEFAAKFPDRVDKNMGMAADGNPTKLALPGQEDPLPVIGGCPLPVTKSALNPFFGNIRQNMDLIGGVGQMPVKKPAKMDDGQHAPFPAWLQKASAEHNNGLAVSDKFLHIEKREQKRMQEALSSNVSYGTPSKEVPSGIRIAGIEKGSKNRYNNIWPFEHSRVKIEDVAHDGCDYFNANHVKSHLSNKRYIATQGPIPATFADFWNVVWQQDVRVIVMLTAEKEGGQVKAHDYWSEKQCGPYRLELLGQHKATLDLEKMRRHRRGSSSRKPSLEDSSSAGARNGFKSDAEANAPVLADEPFVTVRKIQLSHSQSPFEPIREITHLQYAHWPDFGAPAHPAHLLGLVEQCDSVVRSKTRSDPSDPQPASSRPLLVHCSAGCGRTGTFCTVDSVIDMLKRQRNANPSQTESSAMDLDLPAPYHSTSTANADPFFSAPAVQAPATTEPEVAPEDFTLDGKWLQGEHLDLIEKAVEDFRHQRLSMVQSLRQFVLCYESILEWIAEEKRMELET